MREINCTRERREGGRTATHTYGSGDVQGVRDAEFHKRCADREESWRAEGGSCFALGADAGWHSIWREEVYRVAASLLIINVTSFIINNSVQVDIWIYTSIEREKTYKYSHQEKNPHSKIERFHLEVLKTEKQQVAYQRHLNCISLPLSHENTFIKTLSV